MGMAQLPKRPRGEEEPLEETSASSDLGSSSTVGDETEHHFQGHPAKPTSNSGVEAGLSRVCNGHSKAADGSSSTTGPNNAVVDTHGGKGVQCASTGIRAGASMDGTRDLSKAWVQISDNDAAMVRSGGRAHVAVPVLAGGGDDGGGGRFVTVLRVASQLRAFDSICYHAGGPLGIGDIEEAGAGGQACIVCPWHHYLVDLETGHKWHQPMQKDANGKLVAVGWKSSAKPVQRIHEVQEREDGGIFVRLRLDGPCESDHWAQRDDCFRSLQGLAEQHQGGLRGASSRGGDGCLPIAPSGHVLRQSRGVRSPPLVLH